jgi:hypothetical protein
MTEMMTNLPGKEVAGVEHNFLVKSVVQYHHRIKQQKQMLQHNKQLIKRNSIACHGTCSTWNETT